MWIEEAMRKEVGMYIVQIKFRTCCAGSISFCCG